MPAGRPSIYESWMAEKALELLSAGKSLTYVAAKIGVSRETVYAWKQDISEFSDSVKKGLALSQAHWEDVLEQAATGANPDANPATLIFTMKNRFREDWPDTQAVKQQLSGGVMVGHKNEKDMTDDEIIAYLKG